RRWRRHSPVRSECGRRAVGSFWSASVWGNPSSTGRHGGRPLLPADADLRGIDGPEADLKRRGIRFECEIAIFGVSETGVGDNRVRVVAVGLPFLPGHARRSDLATGRVPVAVIVQPPVAVLPGAAQQRTTLKVDDVVLEEEGDVILFTRADDLTDFRVGKGEDVVADQVVLAVVLVIAAVA